MSTSTETHLNGDASKTNTNQGARAISDAEKGTIKFQKGISTRRLLIGGLGVAVLAIIGLTAGVIVLGSRKGSHANTKTEDKKIEYCKTQGCLVAGARIANGMDTRVDPCTDFYQFACGRWKKTHIIPEDEFRYSSMAVMNDDVSSTIKYILERSVSPSDSAAVKKSKMLYKACMNESATEARGSRVLYPLLQEFRGWPLLGTTSEFPTWNATQYDFTDLLLKLNKYKTDPIIDFGVTIDQKNSSRRILYIDQPRLGLPNRDYYLTENTDILEAYSRYAVSVAMSLGAELTTARNQVTALVNFERDLANISDAASMRRNLTAIYNLYELQELQTEFPTQGYLDWEYTIQSIMGRGRINVSIEADETVQVVSPHYLQKVFTVMKNYPNRTIANFMIWRFIMDSTLYLPKQYQNMRANFDKVLSGTAVALPQWKLCSSFVKGNMGMAVGRLFVEETFDQEAKRNALELIRYLRAAFKEQVEELDWMDDTTRRVAVDKLNSIKNRVGYQEAIFKDNFLNSMYENVTAHPDNHFLNVVNSLQTSTIQSFGKLHLPVNKNKWTMMASTVDASYSVNQNAITFPAAFLQPPYYSKTQPNYLNFGGIGLVIGHEITHGFDDSGRQFDKEGNQVQWWSDEVIARFEKRASCMRRQYSKYVVDDIGETLNGNLTLGENIADNGGLKQSFRAYRRWVESTGKEEPRLLGLNLTNNQLLFVNFAQGLCENTRPAHALRLVRTDVHSPGKYRVLGALQNSLDFAREFKCKKESPMNPEHKCYVW